ncbi:beta-ketoacyl-[acyl-carrier-protein] synthase family protein [Streptomyces sp. NWU49]|uniref:Beta-ketoacyl-[acyl-carrier-protein] synthase family protein n=1 Tax=Streptomyces viridosporus T7A TaxID=665577 RepID=A0ABX6AKX8_STRVD|nr:MULTISPECIES: beta-ketoacyl-[acyl-carrier-protein] synthase family protein [Streptomyces]PWJ05930.1 beta-ketoacyl-[acyl-carrier-protein] synthase family protein [Streptomyces sp. NWU49]QEU88286.1 beta-ketoacyl-[acyl-carrier-protein] synthase family protein [Streptomyces viridosporus T7A]
MTGPVAVTGLGLITPAGEDADTTWEAVRRGAGTAADRDPTLAGLPVDFSCRVPLARDDLDRRVGRTAWRMSRNAVLAVLAAREAVHDAGLDPRTWDGDRVAVVIGCGLGSDAVREEQARRLEEQGADMVSALTVPQIIPNMAAGEVSIDLGARGPGLAPATACASGATAVAVARDLLASGRCDIAVAGATEAAVTPLAATAFWRMGTLSGRTGAVTAASRPFAADRDGFVLAEGAGVLVLERAEDAAARGARVRARLVGCGSTSDAHHPTTPAPDARGAEAALRTALADAGLAPHDVDHVNAHGTSTPLNDAGEAALIARVLPHRPSVTAPKGVLGHGLGSAGAVEAALTVLTLQHGTVPPIANLDAPAPGFTIDCVTGEPRRQDVRVAVSHSFGFGGHNVVLVLARAS